jgi:NAD(P)-dependent dehydrogenase (short-subunit alcohol dehydrogenase family)
MFLIHLLTLKTIPTDLVKRPNKVAVMTGGNRGIGLYVIQKLLKCDMIVLLGVRNPEASKKNVEKVLGADVTKDRVIYEKCDTGDMESVREFAKKVQNRFKAIHLLINNGENNSFVLENHPPITTTIQFFNLSRCHVHAIRRDQRWLRVANGD